MPKARQRERDLIWDEMERLFGAVVSGTNAHAKRNKAVKDLKLLGASPQSLGVAKRNYHVHFSGALCTDIALATHYPLLAPKEVAPPCPQCGVGGGMHAADCRYVTSDGAARI